MQKLYTEIKLEILGADIIIENADMALEIKKTDEGQPNYCTCTIYNVSDNTYNILIEKTNSVRVYTNTDDKGYVLIFQGDLRDIVKWKKYKKTNKKRKATKLHYNEPPVTREEDGDNIATIIQLQDGVKDLFLNHYYSKSYSGKISNTTVLNDILNYIKTYTTITIGQIDNLSDKLYTNGLVLQGTLESVLKKICRSGNCKCIIENNVVSILYNNIESDVYGYYLHGGICPRPEFNADKEITVQAPFLPNVNIGNFVKLEFEDIEGIYKVKKIDSKIDNFGEEYETKLVLYGG